MNGIVTIADQIELGHIKAGLVVSCETAREITDLTIKHLNKNPTIEAFKYSMTVLTGGCGAVAVLITDESLLKSHRPRLLGGVVCSDPEFHQICQWEKKPHENGGFTEIMRTDAIAVLNYGVELGKRTWKNFLEVMEWDTSQVDKTICHQVARSNRDMILEAFQIDEDKDFCTYPYLGNIGSVSLPITAAIAEEREFIQAGDNVGFLGIGSGLNCMMLGWKW
jgi:3-oxoacyl-[acyl-carrier-protein] synthase-3